ncbi:MAG: VWA domain-containing protein [Hyphomonadaceae bacterium JAD_PAG50586_4]|nr:MAG: VWA domain-containing protein [Hyphomonadaceae bacterium JAD_PAG50586_4]
MLGRLVKSSKLRAFAGAREGNVAMLWALMGSVLVGLVGLTVDFTRAQAIRVQMQNAADGAALVAERSSNLTLEQRETRARAFFDAEMGTLSLEAEFHVFELDDGGHRVTARLPMPLSLAAVIRDEDWFIRVESEAQASASPPIEVALVLDNTGSMSNDMDALRDAAEDLADFLLGIDGDTVSVALVPFVAQVNVGTAYRNSGWIDTTGAAPFNGELVEDRQIYFQRINNCASSPVPSTTFAGSSVPIVWGACTTATISGNSRQGRWAYAPAEVNYFTLFDQLATINSSYGWGGCVEARPGPHHALDTVPNPAQPETMFSPYFWVDQYGNQSTTGSSNSYLTDSLGATASWSSSNNIWATATQSGNTVQTGRELSPWKYRSGVSHTMTTSAPNARGPNRGCPTPIVPLTTSRTTVINAIQAMQHWNGGGTNQAEGLAWGWRVLSPTAPFTEGRPYDDEDDPVRKVLVLMTDGENTNLTSNSGTGEVSSNGQALQSDYSAFSHLGQWTTSGFRSSLPSGFNRNAITSTGTYVSYINSAQESLCTAIKATGIEIYTIQFRDTNDDNETRLRNCATDEDHFYQAANATELQAAFDAIGSGIGDLRITR